MKSPTIIGTAFAIGWFTLTFGLINGIALLLGFIAVGWAIHNIQRKRNL